MSTVAYFDCFSGVAGDMTLGALIDAGVPLDEIEAGLAKLPIEPFELEVTRVERLGISAIGVRVRAADTGVLRTYAAVRALIEQAELAERPKELALTIFRRLAEAEAKVHGKEVSRVAFHELGSVDTLVDIVGASIALDLLGIEEVHASAVATGMGMIRTDHGIYPVPGPAVVELLKGAPMYSRGIPTELVTPTGAAILAATARSFGDMPQIRVKTVGYGAGTRELEIPNVLRVIVGEMVADEQFGPVPAVVLESNIDDMNPELYEYVLERLFSVGAQDVWTTPIVMKKGRPAVTLSILCGPAEEQAVREVLFSETTTLGLRRRAVEKWMLPREVITVQVEGGTVRVKVARAFGGRVTGASPEYADCVRVAREAQRPLKDVYAEAAAAARALLTD
ncbi:MAG TPA: nickel pincer cofactor biosynthesis protein LarC [Actinomycetota bacterium]|nr:nickel pincer cofactor biosynthesis protein LarC [Actinomycetota bacterium]